MPPESRRPEPRCHHCGCAAHLDERAAHTLLGDATMRDDDPLPLLLATGVRLVSRRRVPAPSLAKYHLLPVVRGDLLATVGHDDGDRAEFERAASLTRNERERTLLLNRAAARSSDADR